MKRGARTTHRLLSGLSLLLLLATAGVWVRSYWVRDEFYRIVDPLDDRDHHLVFLACSRGGTLIGARRDQFEWGGFNPPSSEHRVLRAEAYPSQSDPKPSRLNLRYRSYEGLGFQWATIESSDVLRPRELSLHSFTFPLYFPCLLFAILPAHYLLRLRRRQRITRRIAQGCCINCGYDLRASSGRCPECGRVESSTNPP